MNEVRGMSSVVRLLIFFLISSFILFLVTLVIYCLLISRALYSSMIVWRGLNLNVLDMAGFYVILDEISDFFVFELNFTWVDSLMDPLIAMIDFFASLQIDLGAVEVTCQGSGGAGESVFETSSAA